MANKRIPIVNQVSAVMHPGAPTMNMIDVLNVSLCKARGISFLLTQHRKPELVDETCMGFALWALDDFLADARVAADALQDENSALAGRLHESEEERK